MSAVHLRLLAESDLHAYKRLRDQMLTRHPDAFTSDAETERARDAASYRSRLSGGSKGTCLFTLVAASEGGELAGAISCERELRAKVRHIAHVAGMMVAPDHQGRGIGRELLEAAMRLLSKQDSIELITLSVTSSNKVAVKLYETCGFSRYGRLGGALKFPDGSSLDKDLMSRRLR
ncbi:MAG TPA: GNAT family N-acetyltransferase [Burkholderiaceae bacterium]